MEYTRRLARIGDKIIYYTHYLDKEGREPHEATVVDLTESSLWLDDGTWLMRMGIEYALVPEAGWVR